jgi:tRNA threonylcarbamoyladenosine biosynthesis protein TsaE
LTATLHAAGVLDIPDEAAMSELGRQMAAALAGTEGCSIHLHGELGSGKTTLTRGILRALGVTDRIKSPTYTLIEPYELGNRMAYHLDLYRLADPQELEFLGIRDFLTAESILFVEWPEKGVGVSPEADVHVRIDYAGIGRRVTIEPGGGGRNQWVGSLTG